LDLIGSLATGVVVMVEVLVAMVEDSESFSRHGLVDLYGLFFGLVSSSWQTL
jgi:hypothetical protein